MRDTYLIIMRIFQGYRAEDLVVDWNGEPCGILEVNGQIVDALPENVGPGDEIIFRSIPHVVRGTYVGKLRIKILDMAKEYGQTVFAIFVDSSSWFYIMDEPNARPEPTIRSGLRNVFITKDVAIEEPDEIIAE